MTPAIERRKYRFRAWDESRQQMYPVMGISRGGVVLKDRYGLRSLPRNKAVMMQYIRCLDSGGGEIYEGDLLQLALPGRQAPLIAQVVFVEGAYRIANDPDLGNLSGVVIDEELIVRHRAQVIGTVYGMHAATF